MAPIKQTGIKGVALKTTSLLPLARRGISTRSNNVQENLNPVVTRSKRKADISPLKNDKIKRSALGNLTNNVVNLHLEDENLKRNLSNGKLTSKSNLENKKTVNILKSKNENVAGPSTIFDNATNGIVLRGTKMVTRKMAAVKSNVVQLSVMHNHLVAADSVKLLRQKHKSIETAIKPKDIYEVASRPATRRISNEFEQAEDSLYMSALEDLPLSGESIRFSGQFEQRRKSLLNTDSLKKESLLLPIEEDVNARIITSSPLKTHIDILPDGVEDYDKDNWNDPFQVSHYTMDIFNYLKQREVKFPLIDYMEKQIYLSKWMRSLLVDWMVEVQETFELNHETLYLAVKLVDLYLCQTVVQKDTLQLLGAASLFIACKFDERTPPLVEDFMYICDGAYQHNELIKMEMSVLKTIDFDLGIPLSYRFLRRYARVAKVPMPTLTLARFILEFSLMDYNTISFSDSQMGCAALYIALKMTSNGSDKLQWNETLVYFTGYKLEDFAYIVPVLNSGLHRKPKDAIKTIRKKYSHVIFHEVSKIPLLSMEKLFENTGLLDSE